MAFRHAEQQQAFPREGVASARAHCNWARHLVTPQADGRRLHRAQSGQGSRVTSKAFITVVP